MTSQLHDDIRYIYLNVNVKYLWSYKLVWTLQIWISQVSRQNSHPWCCMRLDRRLYTATCTHGVQFGVRLDWRLLPRAVTTASCTNDNYVWGPGEWPFARELGEVISLIVGTLQIRISLQTSFTLKLTFVVLYATWQETIYGYMYTWSSVRRATQLNTTASCCMCAQTIIMCGAKAVCARTGCTVPNQIEANLPNLCWGIQRQNNKYGS